MQLRQTSVGFFDRGWKNKNGIRRITRSASKLTGTLQLATQLEILRAVLLQGVNLQAGNA